MTTAQFIEKASKVHDNFYNYQEVSYYNTSTKVKILCPQHGLFMQRPMGHLQGQGCPLCGVIKLNSNRKRLSYDEFLTRARGIHGLKYTYDQTENAQHDSYIKITCPIHGEFTQLINSHLNGRGCPKCAKNQLKTIDEFIEDARKIHGNKYQYGNYLSAMEKIKIICPEHGLFYQKPNSHLSGCGCPKCGIKSIQQKLSSNKDDFIKLATIKHATNYDYSKVEYRGNKRKVAIICGIHGEFLQTPNDHLTGYGCPYCADNKKLTTEEFIVRANKIHKFNYDYSQTNYDPYQKITIICHKHGKFEQSAKSHLAGCKCPKCGVAVSSVHLHILEYIQSIYHNTIIVNDRIIIKPLELDIYLPHLKLAVEVNGDYYHSYNRPETTAERMKHRNKSQRCEKLGISLLQINEYEWVNPQTQLIFKSLLAHKLGLNNHTIFARKCATEQITNSTHRLFMEANHLMGHRDISVAYGLYHSGVLLASMSFCKHNKFDWEIIRYAVLCGYNVPGGASKLLAKFIKDHNPQKIMSYADRRYSTGGLYKTLGFKLDGITHPNYIYLDKSMDIHSRQEFQKHKLKNKLKVFDNSKTEAENMFMNGYRRMWDAGNLRFIWTRQ